MNEPLRSESMPPPVDGLRIVADGVQMRSDDGASMVRNLSVRVFAWQDLNWGLVLPLVFAGNVVVATLAWFLVGFLMR